MRLNRFALAGILILAGGFCFAQQGRGGAQAQQQRPPNPEEVADQQLQEAQRMVRDGNTGRGNTGLGGGQVGAQAAPDDPDINVSVNTTDFFSVSVPCKFTTKDITWDTEYDSKVPGRVYSCKSGTTNYELSVINYTDIVKIRASQQHTEAASGGNLDRYARIDVLASVDYAMTKMRNEAAKVTYDAWHYVNLIPGHELQYTLRDGNRVYGAAYLHEYRLYILKASIPANGIPPLLYTQSFAIVRPDGSAIRYAKIYRRPW